MDITIHLNAVAPAKNELPAGLSGVVESIGDGMKGVFSAGDQVMAYHPVTTTAETLAPGKTVTVDGTCVFVKPSQLGFETAAKVAQVLPLLAVGLEECSPERPDAGHPALSKPAVTHSSKSNDTSKTAAPTRSILVTAGETLLGTLLAYLLKQHLPNAQLYSTCFSPNDSLLTATCSRLVGHAGAIYAIDAEAPDLLDHLHAATGEYSGKQGMDLVVDVRGFLVRRPEVRGVLREGGRVVDVEELRADGGLGEVFVERKGVMRRLGGMLEDVPAELFEGVELGAVSP